MPVEESLLYVQPIFVQGSAPNSIPLLQKVAVFYNDQVGYATSLQGAITEVVTGQPTPTPPEDGSPAPPTPTPGGGDVQSLLRRADQAFQAAQAALADGDLATYQRRINEMADLVRQALAAQGDGTAPTTTTRG